LCGLEQEEWGFFWQESHFVGLMCAALFNINRNLLITSLTLGSHVADLPWRLACVIRYAPFLEAASWKWRAPGSFPPFPYPIEPSS